MEDKHNKKTDSDFWDKTINSLKETIPDNEYAMWLSDVRFLEFKKNILTLSVHSTFVRDQIQNRYAPHIKRIYQEYTQTEIELQLIIAEKKTSGSAGSASVKPQTNTAPATRPSYNNASGIKNKESFPPSFLSPEYTFESFVIGNNNSFAANASLAIAKSPGTDYNPCLIYGGVGLGKTHLIQAIGNSIHKAYTPLKIIYVTTETFTNEFISAIRTKTTPIFKNKYRLADILLIDDIHFLQGKPETQEEVFHTFNALYAKKKQMVFTCDRPVSEITDFTDRLRSRFVRGLNVDLQPPSYETRVAIINKKIEMRQDKLSLDDDIINYIAENITTNVRDLEAAIIKLAAYYNIVGKRVTLDVAKEQLYGLLGNYNATNITIQHIQKIVAEYFNISFTDLIGKKKTRIVTFPRQLSIFLVREITDCSFTEIGLEFGGRDHTTIMYSIQQIKKKLQADSSIEHTIKTLTSLIYEKWRVK